jgi:thiosulfate/3-mercaptopyruvate sulfurtransferase
MQSNQILVDANFLAAHRAQALTLIDTREAHDYWTGHLAGALHFDPFPFHFYDTSPKGTKEFEQQIEWIFSALGITGSETVVFYEKGSGMRAARAFWMLEYLGHPSVRILDGGIESVNHPSLELRAGSVTPVKFKVTPRADTIATVDQVLRKLGTADAQIFDVRSDAEYFGENVRARHGGAIPGALHLEWTESIDSSGAFKAPDRLHDQFVRLGLDRDREVITYCQGGYRSAHSYVALRLAGFERVRNYLASWGEWGNREDLPIEHPKRSK